MSGLLDQALALVREAFADARRGACLVDSAELEAEVAAAQRVINAASAVQAVRMAQYAAREEVRQPDGRWAEVDRGVGHVTEFGEAPIGAALGLSPAAASARTVAAAKWASCLPRTLSAMAEGSLDSWRASVLADELRDAGREVCAEVEGMVFPAVLDDTAGQVRRRVRRALLRVDGDAVRQRALRATAERGVWVRPGEPGVAELTAVLPTEDMMRLYAAVDALAHRARGDDETRTIGQCRADALVDLVLGHSTVTTTVALGVPVELLTVQAEPLPGEPTWAQVCAMGIEVPGVGVIPGHVAAGICRSFDTNVTRVLLDTSAGVVLGTGATTYRPPAKVSDFVKLRDGTCRFPGCRVRATRCDGDHVVPWPVGSTGPANLVSLCRHHHRLKTHTRWRLEMTADGVCTWTSPVGDRYVTHPVDHLALAA